MFVVTGNEVNIYTMHRYGDAVHQGPKLKKLSSGKCIFLCADSWIDIIRKYGGLNYTILWNTKKYLFPFQMYPPSFCTVHFLHLINKDWIHPNKVSVFNMLHIFDFVLYTMMFFSIQFLIYFLPHARPLSSVGVHIFTKIKWKCMSLMFVI